MYAIEETEEVLKVEDEVLPVEEELAVETNLNESSPVRSPVDHFKFTDVPVEEQEASVTYLDDVNIFPRSPDRKQKCSKAVDEYE